MRLRYLHRFHRGRKVAARDIRFQILYRLFFRSFSNSSIVTPSTPGAPSLAFTCRYASHTSCLEISNGLPCDFCPSTRFLPGTLVDRTGEPRTARPLRSTSVTEASALLRAGPPARRRDGTRSLTGSARLRHSLSPPLPPGSRVAARLPTFRARAAEQAHVACVPDTAWPRNRAPARLIPGLHWKPRFRCHLVQVTAPQTAIVFLSPT